MCRFSKEYSECDGQHDDCSDLGRRSIDQFLQNNDTPTHRRPSTLEMISSVSNIDFLPRNQSLSDEIDHLIKWNREKSTLQ